MVDCRVALLPRTHCTVKVVVGAQPPLVLLLRLLPAEAMTPPQPIPTVLSKKSVLDRRRVPNVSDCAPVPFLLRTLLSELIDPDPACKAMPVTLTTDDSEMS